MYSNGPRIVHRPLTRHICPGRPVRFFGRPSLICISLPPLVFVTIVLVPTIRYTGFFFIRVSTNKLNTVIASNNNDNNKKN